MSTSTPITGSTNVKVAVYVCGGLGNQLFQFATLIAYCRKYGFQPVFDRKYHGELHSKDLFWEQFELLKRIVSEYSFSKPTIYQENDAIYQPIPPFFQSGENSITQDGSIKEILLRGYFNNEKYFLESKDEIRELFQQCIISALKIGNTALNEQIDVSTTMMENGSIGIHVRRGDYLKIPHVFHITNMAYYNSVLQNLNLSVIVTRENENVEPKIVIVSEDITWCNQNFLHTDSKLDTVVFRNGTILEDFYFLMCCSKLIITNSTFSWWAAYLNPFTSPVFERFSEDKVNEPNDWKVAYPLEWFSNHLAHRYKFNTSFNNVWKMFTHKSNQEIFSMLYEYLNNGNYSQISCIVPHLHINCNTINEIFEWKFFEYVSKITSEQIMDQEKMSQGADLIHFSQTHDKPLSLPMKKYLNQFVPEIMQQKINLREIPLYVITGEERKIHMLARFENISQKYPSVITLYGEPKQFTPIIVPAIPCQEKCEGCVRAHMGALENAIQKNIFPCVIFEDDVVATEDFVPEFSIPVYADAVFLGISRYGMGDWNQMGIRGRIINKTDICTKTDKSCIQYYQIFNMLSAHAIMYCTKKYAIKTLEILKACLTLKYINDVGTARLQAENTVLAVEKPFFVQDVLYAKNSGQRQNNLETYVKMTEFPH